MPKDHLIYFLSDLVNQLDLPDLYERYPGDGRRNSPFDPGMMFKVLIYSYATGTFSPRKTTERMPIDVARRALAAGNFPKLESAHVEAYVGMGREGKSLSLGTERKVPGNAANEGPHK